MSGYSKIRGNVGFLRLIPRCCMARDNGVMALEVFKNADIELGTAVAAQTLGAGKGHDAC